MHTLVLAQALSHYFHAHLGACAKGKPSRSCFILAKSIPTSSWSTAFRCRISRMGCSSRCSISAIAARDQCSIGVHQCGISVRSVRISAASVRTTAGPVWGQRGIRAGPVWDQYGISVGSVRG
eukprot:173747-Chlamydomonas_euryale.AAC.2